MRERSRFAFACLGGLGLMAGSLVREANASAYDTLAVPCVDDPFYCETAPISFDKTDALPIQFMFDTGWVPAGSPLQVHIFASITAETRVHLAGQFATTWPKALTLKTPGDTLGGALSYDYGVMTGAQAMVDIDVLGENYTWMGDIPYVPEIDLDVMANSEFDAWGFAPGVTASSKSASQEIAKVSIGDIIGGSIPGIDGGFQLDIAVELAATYVTNRIVIDKVDTTPVDGGPITSEDGVSSVKYKGGPNIEADIHPEGTVDYEGILHLIPTFYVSLLGQNFSIPVADIPIPFPIAKTDWIFDKKRAHVPIPDLVVPSEVIDFGQVEVGQKLLKPYSLLNAGEAAVTLAVTSSDPDQFAPFDDQTNIAGDMTFETAMRFIPNKAGDFTATISVASNDPSDPVQTFVVHGIGFDGTVVASVDPAPSIGEEGSCACRTGDAPRSSAPAFAAMALLLGAGALRRRRRASN